MTSPKEIKEWLDRVQDSDEYSHMLVLCDTFDHENFQLYVSKHDNIHEVVNVYDNRPDLRVMEVYNLNMDLKSQLNQDRAYNL